MIIRYNSFLYFFSIFFLFTNAVNSKTTHGLSMHGNPKYDKNFTHFEYSYPEAPKGGVIKFGIYGNYNMLVGCWGVWCNVNGST